MKILKTADAPFQKQRLKACSVEKGKKKGRFNEPASLFKAIFYLPLVLISSTSKIKVEFGPI